MTVALEVAALCIAARDPWALARFWSAVLHLEVAATGDALVPDAQLGFTIRFLPTDEPKRGLDRTHLDLTSATGDDQQETVEQVLRLGGRHLDVGQRGDQGHVVLADPEGNEFCVIEPGNRFLAGCGRVGALAGDGRRETGVFWSAALGWPLVWDQDEETAVQSPRGGPKVTWGGPPVAPKTGRNRLHLDLAPAAGSRQRAEVERLLALGAGTDAAGTHHPGAVALVDPDGNEFCVLPPG